MGVPVEDERRAGSEIERLSLGALAVGVEDDPASARVEATAEDHARRGATFRIDGRKRHRMRVPDLGEGFFQPALDERERIRRKLRGQGGLSNPLPPEGGTRWSRRSEERRVGKECRSRWSPYH